MGLSEQIKPFILTPMYVNIPRYQQTTEKPPKPLTVHLVCYFIHTGMNVNSRVFFVCVWCVCLFTLPTVCLEMMEYQKQMV